MSLSDGLDGKVGRIIGNAASDGAGIHSEAILNEFLHVTGQLVWTDIVWRENRRKNGSKNVKVIIDENWIM